jgi:hypothetical protein
MVKAPHKIGCHSTEDTLKHYWVYPAMLAFILTLWNVDLIGYAGLLMARLYSIFYM